MNTNILLLDKVSFFYGSDVSFEFYEYSIILSKLLKLQGKP